MLNSCKESRTNIKTLIMSKVLTEVGQRLKERFERNEAMCQKVIGMFQLVSNKTRFRIVCVLEQGEFCVQEIADIVGAERLSNISQQLKALRLAGIIASRREGTKVIYRLANEQVRHMIEYLHKEFLGETGTN